MKRYMVGLLLAVGLLVQGCAGVGGSFKQVAFSAPSPPDPELRTLMEGVDSIGVVTTTNIEPFRELDIEKVMGRLADGTARGLSYLPEAYIVSQDEIRWRFKEAVFDSTTILDRQMHQTLRDEFSLDGLVFVELKSLKAQMTPMSPNPYGGLSPNPGLDMSVNLQIVIINLETGESWSQAPVERRNWQPVQLNLFSGNDQTERQLLVALAGPLQQFLAKVAPPPRPQIRHFEVSGE